jgi:hypothetical protein
VQLIRTSGQLIYTRAKFVFAPGQGLPAGRTDRRVDATAAAAAAFASWIAGNQQSRRAPTNAGSNSQKSKRLINCCKTGR